MRLLHLSTITDIEAIYTLPTENPTKAHAELSCRSIGPGGCLHTLCVKDEVVSIFDP
jgi:hypothetical protein